MDINHMNLADLGGGAAVEKWAEELQRIAENIIDPNTEATAKREVTLKVAIKPTKERRDAEVTISVASKLAPQIAVQTRAYFAVDRRTGEVHVAEHNPDQLVMAFAKKQHATSLPVNNSQLAEETEDDR